MATFRPVRRRPVCAGLPLLRVVGSVLVGHFKWNDELVAELEKLGKAPNSS